MPELTTISNLKKELETKSARELLTICLRLCRFKKENKELVAFLLFDAENPDIFISEKKREISSMFEDVNTSHIFYAKKTIRKILRFVNKNVRISGNRQAEAEMLISFCRELKEVFPNYHRYKILAKLYETQHKKISRAIESLHPDLQYDLYRELEKI